MNELDERRLRARLAAFADMQDSSDWDDVLRRARPRPLRRSPLALAAALATLLAVSALALGGRAVVGFFSAEGTPIPRGKLVKADRNALTRLCDRIRLVSAPGKAPAVRCLGGNPRIEEIANDGRRRYLIVRYPGGRTCLASGYAGRRGGQTIGLVHCGSLDGLLPTPKHPITVDAVVGMDRGDTQMYVYSVSGLAGEGVARVRLVDEDTDAALEQPVRGRAYSLPQVPKGGWDAIAAIAADGDELYREDLGLEGGRPVLTRPPRQSLPPPIAQPPPPRPRFSGPVSQRGHGDGVSARAYRGGVVIELSEETPGYRFLRRSGERDVTLSCFDVAYGAGRWEALEGAGGSSQLARRMTFVVAGDGRFGTASPPFDACVIADHAGHRWNDVLAMHYPIEVAFTRLGRRFLAERAAARTLASFLRSPAMARVRSSLVGGKRAPSAAAVAGHYTDGVVALRGRRTPVRTGQIGISSDRIRMVVAVTRADDGRRLYVELPGGRLGKNNLYSLASYHGLGPPRR